MDHGFDRRAHELRRVVLDAVFHALREVFFQFVHLGAHVGRQLQRVGIRCLENTHADGRIIVQQRTQRVAVGAHFHARHVLQVRHGAVRIGAHDDGAKFLGRLQTALSIDGQLEVRVFCRRGADDTCGHLHVLLADGVDDVIGRHAARRHFLRVEPDAHGVVTRAKDLDVAHAGQARQLVLDVEHGVVTQVHVVIALVRRHQMHHHGQVGRRLDGRHADLAHFLGQARQGALHTVLHLRLGLLDVGADLEGHGQHHRAVGRVLRGHVEHVLDAVDLLFERRGDGFGDHFRVSTRILRAHHHGWRHDVGIFGDGQAENRQ